MPRTFDPAERRKLYVGMGDGLANAVYIVTATAVWAGIGYLMDRWLGTWPILFAIGTVLGNFTGVWVLYRKSVEQSGDPARHAPGVTRQMPAIGGREGTENDE